MGLGEPRLWRHAPRKILNFNLFNDIAEEFDSYELWGFCDTSMTAYAAVVYKVARKAQVNL